MLARTYSAQITGLEPDLIDVEVDISRAGLHSFSIVGLPDKAIQESEDRISAAIKNCGFQSPKKGNRRIVVSLAPADLKKEGPIFDLAIALALLAALRQIKFDPAGKLFLGELALDGSIRPIKGALLLAEMAREAQFEELYLPVANAREAALVSGLKIFAIKTLADLATHLEGGPSLEVQPKTKISYQKNPLAIDFDDVAGQETAKRGLAIAAAGRHNVAMSGPPGTGKTMLARAFLSILPDLSESEILEVTGIHSTIGTLEGDFITKPPFRSPHHSASYAALVGGGNYPRPGEITLAHKGVLFLDEFPEFDRRVINSLRQPLEDRIVNVARARGSNTFPADFILIAAMNPCQCGNRGSPNKICICTPSALSKYERKMSGPIIDRIDLWLEVPQLEHEKLSRAETSVDQSDQLRKKMEQARAIQAERFRKEKTITTNSQMGVRELKKYCQLSPSSTILLNQAAKKHDLSARAYHRVIKLARTIADLDQSEKIQENHLMEAIQYRPKQTNY